MIVVLNLKVVRPNYTWIVYELPMKVHVNEV